MGPCNRGLALYKPPRMDGRELVLNFTGGNVDEKRKDELLGIMASALLAVWENRDKMDNYFPADVIDQVEDALKAANIETGPANQCVSILDSY